MKGGRLRCIRLKVGRKTSIIHLEVLNYIHCYLNYSRSHLHEVKPSADGRGDRAAGNSLAGNGNPLVSGYTVIKH